MIAGGCAQFGCRADIVDGERCVQHRGEQAWESFLRRIGSGLPLNELRGCTVDADAMAQVLASLDRRGKLHIAGADFTGTTFSADVIFKDVEFSKPALFTGAKFLGSLKFDDVRFGAEARFDGVRIGGELRFENVLVTGEFRADEVIHVGAGSVANGLTCEKDFRIEGLSCGGGVEVDRSIFSADADWGVVEAGSLTCSAHFRSRLLVRTRSRTVDFTRSRFDQGISLTVESGDAILDRVTFGAASTVAGTGDDAVAAVVSLVDVDISDLTLREVDVSRCAFGLAHGVDEVTVDGVRFGRPRYCWQTHRAIIAEERDPAASPASVARVYRLLRKAFESSKDEPGAADFYYGEMLMRRRQRWRDIRTAGSGGRLSSFVEYSLLLGYGVISGFGLRAGRALTAFLSLVMVAAALLAARGFPAGKTAYAPIGTDARGYLIYAPVPPAPDGFWSNAGRAIRLAAQSSVSLLQTPAQPLTPVGEWVVLVCRFAGPIIAGLAILAVHNKLRR
ncbi:pentapeptide repeat-containing protein [Nocardia harenae]|uniref:pentapeptide repeat-containing protein n=1 Tax=Nocardia harenae TaxID=358707 RepID=UPI000A4E0C55|nr:pentapeptide repeat-containing protein [Nocardia harenae]